MNGRHRHVWWAPVLIAGIWIWGPGAAEAHAYVDPGTGGALFSSLPILLGIFSAGIAVCFSRARRTLHWIREKVSRRSDSAPVSEPGESAS